MARRTNPEPQNQPEEGKVEEPETQPDKEAAQASEVPAPRARRSRARKPQPEPPAETPAVVEQQTSKEGFPDPVVLEGKDIQGESAETILGMLDALSDEPEPGTEAAIS